MVAIEAVFRRRFHGPGIALAGFAALSYVVLSPIVHRKGEEKTLKVDILGSLRKTGAWRQLRDTWIDAASSRHPDHSRCARVRTCVSRRSGRLAHVSANRTRSRRADACIVHRRRRRDRARGDRRARRPVLFLGLRIRRARRSRGSRNRRAPCPTAEGGTRSHARRGDGTRCARRGLAVVAERVQAVARRPPFACRSDATGRERVALAARPQQAARRRRREQRLEPRLVEQPLLQLLGAVGAADDARRVRFHSGLLSGADTRVRARASPAARPHKAHLSATAALLRSRRHAGGTTSTISWSTVETTSRTTPFRLRRRASYSPTATSRSIRSRRDDRPPAHQHRHTVLPRRGAVPDVVRAPRARHGFARRPRGARSSSTTAAPTGRRCARSSSRGTSPIRRRSCA